MSDKSFEEIWKKEIINSIMSNTDYVERLKVICQKYSLIFCSNDINYIQRKEYYKLYKGLSESDKRDFEKLCYFFEIIDKLYPSQRECTSKMDLYGKEYRTNYKIKYNDFSFEIEELVYEYSGETTSQIKLFNLKKIEIKQGDKFIDFNDAMALYKSIIANESTKEDIHVGDEYTEVVEEKTDEVLEKETNNMENELNKKTSKNEKLKSKLALKKKILKEIKEQIELSKSLKKQLEECDREYIRLTKEYQNLNVKENGNKYGTK